MTEKEINNKGLHPRNPHNERYDFPALIASYPSLRKHVSENQYGDDSINFSDAEAVLELNKALLAHFYHIKNYNIPKGHLCPPIPGRADYIHYLADLLAQSNNDKIPTANVIGLDIGVGANCIYPIIGNSIYDWSFVGADIDGTSIDSAKSIILDNYVLQNNIELRQQFNSDNIFVDIIREQDRFDFTLCNPPFHSSLKEATAGSERKVKNLSINSKRKGNTKDKYKNSSNKSSNMPSSLNFGGSENELWCPGGESSFIKKMITQSVPFHKNCFWFTTLVSKKENLPGIYKALKIVKPTQVKTIEMKTGQKMTRFVAWTFLSKKEQSNWYRK